MSLMPLSALENIPLMDVRVVVAALATLILLYWTYERLVGQGRDPVIRQSSSSATGSASVLVSGSMAILVVAGVAVGALLSPMGGGPIAEPQPVLLLFGAIFVVHWIVEKEELED